MPGYSDPNGVYTPDAYNPSDVARSQDFFDLQNQRGNFARQFSKSNPGKFQQMSPAERQAFDMLRRQQHPEMYRNAGVPPAQQQGQGYYNDNTDGLDPDKGGSINTGSLNSTVKGYNTFIPNSENMEGGTRTEEKDGAIAQDVGQEDQGFGQGQRAANAYGDAKAAGGSPQTDEIDNLIAKRASGNATKDDVMRFLYLTGDSV